MLCGIALVCALPIGCASAPRLFTAAAPFQPTALAFEGKDAGDLRFIAYLDPMEWVRLKADVKSDGARLEVSEATHLKGAGASAPTPLGLKGIARAADGSYWMAEASIPSICHFAADGKLVERLVPKGANSKKSWIGTEILPAAYGVRRGTQGFQAIAYASGKVYAFLPPAPARIVELDSASRALSAEYDYPLEGPERGAEHAAALPDGSLLTLERGKVFRLLLDRSTQAARKAFVLDLSAQGIHADHIRGLAVVDRSTLAVLASSGDSGAGLSLTLVELKAVGGRK